MKFILATIVVLAVLVFTASAVWACADYRSQASQLLGQYQELSRVTLIAATYRFEVWTNETTGTWTILRVDTRGGSCVMAEGEGIVNSGITLPHNGPGA